jgi:uncharacterized membrane protein YcaP (DUF421 family)
MDLAWIAVRSLVAYAYLFAVVRLTGKRALSRATPFDFVMSLVVGDLVDNAIWGQVPLSQFFTAIATFFAVRLVIGTPLSTSNGSPITRARG